MLFCGRKSGMGSTRSFQMIALAFQWNRLFSDDNHDTVYYKSKQLNSFTLFTLKDAKLNTI